MVFVSLKQPKGWPVFVCGERMQPSYDFIGHAEHGIPITKRSSPVNDNRDDDTTSITSSQILSKVTRSISEKENALKSKQAGNLIIGDDAAPSSFPSKPPPDLRKEAKRRASLAQRMHEQQRRTALDEDELGPNPLVPSEDFDTTLRPHSNKRKLSNTTTTPVKKSRRDYYNDDDDDADADGDSESDDDNGDDDEEDNDDDDETMKDGNDDEGEYSDRESVSATSSNNGSSSTSSLQSHSKLTSKVLSSTKSKRTQSKTTANAPSSTTNTASRASVNAKRDLQQKMIDGIEQIRRGPYGSVIPPTLGPNGNPIVSLGSLNYAQLVSEYHRVSQMSEALKYSEFMTSLLLNGTKMSGEAGSLVKKLIGRSFGLEYLHGWDRQLQPSKLAIESAFGQMYTEEGPMLKVSGRTNLAMILATTAIATIQSNREASKMAAQNATPFQNHQVPAAVHSPQPQGQMPPVSGSGVKLPMPSTPLHANYNATQPSFTQKPSVSFSSIQSTHGHMPPPIAPVNFETGYLPRPSARASRLKIRPIGSGENDINDISMLPDSSSGLNNHDDETISVSVTGLPLSSSAPPGNNNVSVSPDDSVSVISGSSAAEFRINPSDIIIR